ncbi:lasso peptide biosynthesis B2 protein [Anianabacter salinae]|uniref:lasso peptide biosynthesis B2 protein n=1 Tax=Anianabacter salinae TaxID=2851023 RepID=UPI00225DFFD8|nr:lasso peptide biosynthesis B2 protein [Anianabacter salinae]MBV0913042.1 lasso peptide biosynthesis B2 protein [Anianabacter salinae]
MAGLNGKIGRLARWPAARRALALEAAAELTRASLHLRLIPFRRIAARLQTPVAEGGQPQDSRIPARIGSSVTLAARNLPWRPKCLAQAMAARRMLARRGIACSVVFGVQGAPEGVRAHAWVTVEGDVIVGGGGLDGFQTIAALGENAAGSSSA